MNTYIVQWSDGQMKATDEQLKKVHGAVAAMDGVQPSDVELCGSYMIRALIADADTPPAADLCVAMPADTCSPDQVLNGEYLTIRDAFVTALHAHLAASDVGQCELVRLPARGNKLAVRVVGASGGTLPVFVHARPAAVQAQVASEKSVKKLGGYAHSVMEDAAMPTLLKVLHGTFSSAPTLLKATLLLKAWSVHCGLSASRDQSTLIRHTHQLPLCLLSALVSSLHASAIVSASMTEENIIRSVWVQIARGVLDNGFELPSCGFAHLNFLHRSSKHFLQHFVKPAAEEALKGDVAAVFAHPRIFVPLTFDCALEVSGLEAASDVVAEKVQSTLAYVLSDRSDVVMVDQNETTTRVFIRIRNVSDGRSKLTRGPSIESPDCAAFNTFWGADKVSTRQFADGSIHRCVYWGHDLLQRGAACLAGHTSPADVVLPVTSVIAGIVASALRLHVSPTAIVRDLFEDVSDVLREKIGETYVDSAPIAAPRLALAMTRAQQVVTDCTQSVACKIIGFDIVSASARETEPYPVRPHVALTTSTESCALLQTAPSIEPIYCVLTIDDKHKIPDTIEAITTMKGALCAQLSNALKDGGFESFCASASVDFVLSGYLFRVFIAHYREVSLLRALERHPQADAVERRFFWATQHAKYISTALTRVFDAYSTATRLAKRWLGAMYLSDFVTTETVELLVAHCFLHGKPLIRSPVDGFFRFLHLLATFQWAKEALVLDVSAAPSAGKTWDREVMGMVVVAPYDTTATSPFSAHTPRPMIMSRLVDLARAALKALAAGSLGTIFMTDATRSFDFVVPLADTVILHPQRCIGRPSPAPRLFRLWRLDELSGADRQRYITQLAELEPVAHCLKQVRAATRDQCMVFTDACGPHALAVVALSPHPTHKQLRALLEAIVAAAPKGSVSAAVHLPPPPPPAAAKGKKAKTARDGDAGEQPAAPSAGADEGQKGARKGKKGPRIETEATPAPTAATSSEEHSKARSHPKGGKKKVEKVAKKVPAKARA